jgi:hypothetical protein
LLPGDLGQTMSFPGLLMGKTMKHEDYAARLKSDRTRSAALFRELLIGVTDFFRNTIAGREYPRGTNSISATH